MSELDNIFGNASGNDVDVTNEEVAVVSEKDDKKEAMKAKIKEMNDVFADTIAKDSTFVGKINAYSKFIEVTNTIGFSRAGGLKKDDVETEKLREAAKKDPEYQNPDGTPNMPKIIKKFRALKTVPGIVGYRLKNTGTVDIPYTTEEYVLDKETGKYVGTVVEKVFKAGETIDLDRVYMTKLCAIPEISFTLANGTIKLASSGANKKLSLKEELRSYYFVFNRTEDGTSVTVNDDNIKIMADNKGVMKKEFVKTFGYLNNPKEVKERTKKGSKPNNQIIAANYINKLVNKQA